MTLRRKRRSLRQGENSEREKSMPCSTGVVPLDELRPAPTSAIADWIVAAGEGTWGHVNSMVPAVFDAYVLVLYPLYDDDDRRYRWADWPIQPVPIDVQDCFGGNPRSVLPLLAAALRAATTTPDDCRYGIWTGNDRSQIPEEHGPILDWPRGLRDYYLYRGPLEAAVMYGSDGADWWLGPNQIWPADRTWFFAADVDPAFAVIGGSEGLIEAILANAELETRRTEATDPNGGLLTDASTRCVQTLVRRPEDRRPRSG